jgi:hypothetical protein
MAWIVAGTLALNAGKPKPSPLLESIYHGFPIIKKAVI